MGSTGSSLGHPASPINGSQMHAMNAAKTKGAAYKAQHVRFNRLTSVHIQKGDPDSVWKSHATNFGRGGIDYQGKSYIRDPRSGVWFHQQQTHFPGLDPTPTSAYVAKHDGDIPTMNPRGSSGLGEMHLSGTVISNMMRTGGRGLKRTSSAPAGQFGLTGTSPTGDSSRRRPMTGDTKTNSSSAKRRPPVKCGGILPGVTLHVHESYQ